MREIKRSDKQYVEVEEFADYELTQCIAYEMCAREKEHKNIAKQVVDYYDTHKIFLDDIFFNRVERKIFYEGGEHIIHMQSLINSIGILNLEDTPLNYQDPRLGNDFWEVKDMYDKFSEVYIDETINFINNNDDEEVGVVKTTVREGYVINTSLLSYEDDIVNHYEKPINVKNANDYKKYIEDTPWTEPIGEVEIVEYFRRPKIDIDNLKSLSTNLTIDLTRPTKEIIALITHIKRDIEENDLLHAPIELLGELLEVSDTNLSKKKLADKFFVYDYVKARLEEIEELNKEIQKAFNEEVEQIKSNPYLDGADKTTQINMLKKDLRENVINTSINDIFEEEELTDSIPKGTAKRYYYEMKPYIEDEKYKELITGIRT